MSNEFWGLVETTFFDVVQLPPESRKTFLSTACAERPDVQREVESLLEHEEAARELNPCAVMVTAAEMLADDDSGLIGSIVGGRYLIRACLGTGGTAEVYLADHIVLDTQFALKRPKPSLGSDPTYRKNFVEEARRAVRLKHDNITRVHDVIDVGEDVFIVMEYVDGSTLRSRLDEAGPFSVDEFLPIATQCAAALAAAHEERIAHLDVKPGNIMLAPSSKVKVCDFGIARKFSDDAFDDTTDTSTWALAGTPAYIAPEVILSHQFDVRADVFSLGVVFYEMLTGRNPFWTEPLI